MKVFLILIAMTAVKPIGYPGRIEGRCEVFRKDRWERIVSSTSFYEGDRVRAYEDCRLEIILDDETVINVNPGTEISIDEYLMKEGKRKSRLSVYIGKILIFFKKVYMRVKGNMEVRTPTAVVGVRGTKFMVNVYSPSETEVIVIEDEVVVRSIKEGLGSIILKEGERTAVFEGEPPTPPERVNMEKVKKFIKSSVPELYVEPDREAVTEMYREVTAEEIGYYLPVLTPPVEQTPQSGAKEVFKQIEGGEVDIKVIFKEK